VYSTVVILSKFGTVKSCIFSFIWIYAYLSVGIFELINASNI
jgi:hypothetical protein